METLLDRVRRGQIGTTPTLTELLFQALDMMKVLAAEVQTLEVADLDVDNLVARLEVLAAGEAGAASQLERVRPSAMVAPVGTTHHLVVQFEVQEWASVRAFQVLLAIDEIGSVLASNPTREAIVTQQVKTRLEVFLRTARSEEEIRDALSFASETQILRLVDVDEMTSAAPGRLARSAGEGKPVDPAPPLPAPVSPGAGAPLVEAEAARASSSPGEPDGAWAAAAAAATGRRPGARQGSGTVRIDVGRLDRLLNLVGELVIDRTRLLGLGRAMQDEIGEHQLLSEIVETTFHLGRVTDELQSEVMKSRMLPIGTVFGRFPRVTRDLSTRQHKKVELVLEGQDTELDRSVIEEIGDPLVHLLRNAIDHGVEPPEDRLAIGKPEVATVRLAAAHVENSIVITVEDNGRGIDPEMIKATAVERGIITAEAAQRMSEAEAVELIFAPGFTTTSSVTDISGRGVGMDIVRTNVERLGGSVEVQTRLGEGSRFFLRLPLTLAIVQALLVRVGGGIYALPLASVTETLRVPVADVQRLQQQEAIVLRGRVLPVVRLSQLFHCQSEAPANPRDMLIVAVKLGDRQVGLAVDRLLGEQEVVIKALGDLIGDVPGISSAAILGDGSVALIVDVPALVQRLASDRQDWRWSDGRDAGTSAQAFPRSA
jgi:two-component system chemotaxis sensor kinase CheA